MSFLDKLLRGHPPNSALKLARNDPCWCNSGKKYKKCHYEEDRKYFAALMDKACKGPV